MTNRSKITLAGTILLFLGLALLIQFFSPNIADPDAFYHITHAQIYRDNGIFYTQFPWVQDSAISKYQADIWYGFHLFLIPFTYFKDKVFGLKFAAAIEAFIVLLLLYWSLKRLKVKWPALWPILFMVSAPDVLYRLMMTRPHNLSLGLSVLALSFAIAGGFWPLLIVGAATSFIHLALGWLPVAIVLVVNFVRKLQKQTIEWKKLGAVTLGSIIGLVLHPNFIGAIKLFYVQVIELTILKLQKVPLIFGRELNASDANGFLRQILPLAVILVPTFLSFWYLRKKLPKDEAGQKIKTGVYSASLMAAIFIFIAGFIFRRSYDHMAGYGVMAMALAVTASFTIWEENYKKRNRLSEYLKIKKYFLAVAIIIIGLAAANSVPLAKTYISQAWSPRYLKDVSLWLKDNTQPGEVVFNTRWDYFGGLFFWDQKNYFINGMDPTFMYDYDQSLYWKWHFIANDVGYDNTCPKIKCLKEDIVPTHETLVNDFHAKYVMLRLIQNPKTYFYWLKENKFPLVFDNKQEAIFKIPPLP